MKHLLCNHDGMRNRGLRNACYRRWSEADDIVPQPLGPISSRGTRRAVTGTTIFSERSVWRWIQRKELLPTLRANEPCSPRRIAVDGSVLEFPVGAVKEAR